MNDTLESAKDTIREHPVETAIAAGIIGIGLTYFFTKRSNPQPVCNHRQGPSWFTRYLEYRTKKLELKLAALNRQ